MPVGWENGSPGRTRTADPVINSHLLYRLSYRGIRPAILTAEGGVVKSVEAYPKAFFKRAKASFNNSIEVAKDKRK